LALVADLGFADFTNLDVGFPYAVEMFLVDAFRSWGGFVGLFHHRFSRSMMTEPM